MYATSPENRQTKKTHRTHHIPKTAKEFLPLIFLESGCQKTFEKRKETTYELIEETKAKGQTYETHRRICTPEIVSEFLPYIYSTESQNQKEFGKERKTTHGFIETTKGLKMAKLMTFIPLPPRQQKNSSPLFSIHFTESQFQKTFEKRKAITHGFIERTKPIIWSNL